MKNLLILGWFEKTGYESPKKLIWLYCIQMKLVFF